MIGVYYNRIQNGPGKVVSNLLLGLNNFGIRYTLNKDADINLILQDCNRLSGNLSNCYLGPNIVVLPIDNNNIMRYNDYIKCIVPSEWVKNKYQKWIPENKLYIWAAGIDTDKFKPNNSNKEIDFLIYYKRRSESELKLITSFLSKNNYTYTILKYGNYKEDDFLNLINKSKYGLVIDGTESQGIAIQEMMSCNLPLLIWDVSYWDDRGYDFRVEATSVPYWSSVCGEKFNNLDNLENTFNMFINTNYSPREFILNNLSINICTERLIHDIL
jgi:hypothetical protein